MKLAVTVALLIGCGGGRASVEPPPSSPGSAAPAEAPIHDAAAIAVADAPVDASPDIPAYARRTPIPTLTPKQLTADECRAEAATLARFLADTPHEKHPFLAQRGFRLVHRTDLSPAPTPPAVIINASTRETTFQGMVVHRTSLAEKLRTTEKRDRLIYLRIEPEVAWSKVVELVQTAVAAGFTRPVFAFQIDAPVTPPPPSPIDAALQGNGSLTDLRKAVLEPCPPLDKLVRAGEGVDPAKQIVAGVGSALVDCNCSTDLPSARSLLWWMIAVKTTAGVIGFDGRATEKLALPGSMTWAEANKRLSAGKSYQLAVE